VASQIGRVVEVSQGTLVRHTPQGRVALARRRSMLAGRRVRHGQRIRVVPPSGVIVPGRGWPATAADVGEERLSGARIGRPCFPQGKAANYRYLILCYRYV
jgi:hypothetical protein